MVSKGFEFSLYNILYNYGRKFIYQLNYFLSLNFQFLLKNNIFCLNLGNKYFYFFYLPSFFFLKKKKSLLKFIFLKKKYYFSFLKNFFVNYLYCKNIYFFRLKLKGLGFFVKRLSKSFLCFFMALNHYFYLNIANFVYLKKKKKHFMFISNKRDKLNIIFWNLMFLKKHNVYVRVKGIGGFIKPNLVRFIKKKNKL